jgi:hypothetical protein
MPGITGQGDTFDLPNYTGELFLVSPQDTPLLSSIGGLTGGKETHGSVYIDWSTYNLRDPDDSRQRLEGAKAPTPEARTRGTGHNILEIHQESVELSYTKQAAIGQVADIGVNNPNVAGITGERNAVTDEMDWQLIQTLKQIARDVEASFTTGTYHDPGDNGTARRTRGLLEAIETVALDAFGQVLTKEMIDNLMQEAWENGGLQVDETRTLLCNATQKRRVTGAYVTEANYRQESRTVGGVHVETIETDFGRLNVMLDRFMPADTLVAASLEDLAPRFLNIPGKGHFFEEPLAKEGAADKTQIYGEIGLEYGDERKHAKIEGLSTDAIGS